jgi:hypothetical protein
LATWAIAHQYNLNQGTENGAVWKVTGDNSTTAVALGYNFRLKSATIISTDDGALTDLLTMNSASTGDVAFLKAPADGAITYIKVTW